MCVLSAQLNPHPFAQKTVAELLWAEALQFAVFLCRVLPGEDSEVVAYPAGSLGPS